MFKTTWHTIYVWSVPATIQVSKKLCVYVKGIKGKGHSMYTKAKDMANNIYLVC